MTKQMSISFISHHRRENKGPVMTDRAEHGVPLRRKPSESHDRVPRFWTKTPRHAPRTSLLDEDPEPRPPYLVSA